MSEPRCFYFGCWERPGHYLFAPNREWFSLDDSVVYYIGGSKTRRSPESERRHLDGTLAPRRLTPSQLADRYGGGLCFSGQGLVPGTHLSIEYNSGECPQGQYLCHKLSNGFTAVQWWDRNQGDKRGGCNSTILLEGDHTAEEVLAAGRRHFPHVFENLKKAGVELVEVGL